MRKQWFLVLAGVSSLIPVLFAHTLPLKVAIAQPSDSSELYYLYFGQKIFLTPRQDMVAVKRSAAPKTPSVRGSGPLPFYLELQQELEGSNERGGDPIPNGAYLPLRGDNYTLIDLRDRSQAAREQTRQKLQQSKTVENVLSVLTRPGEDEAIAIPNEIIVSFDPQLSRSQIDSILSNQGLEMLQVLSPKRKRYLVKLRLAPANDFAVLQMANQLHQVQGVRSATPNFIQASPATNPESFLKESNPSATPEDKVREELKQLKLSSYSQLQWHLDSSLVDRCVQQQLAPACVQVQVAGRPTPSTRTDVYAPEAWKQGKRGRRVVVAVMDSLIQWDHRDLKGNLYSAKGANRCSDEKYGWDFYAGIGTASKSDNICATGDSDTRISTTELQILLPYHQAYFLRDDELIKTLTPNQLASFRQQCKDKGIANCDAAIAEHYRNNGFVVGDSFHGTSVAGVITAKSANQKRLTGIAPNAQLLPIRVAGLNLKQTKVQPESSAVIKGLVYAEQRGVDIINMSFSLVPTTDVTEEIRDVLRDNPKLAIVASAGNDEQNTVGYPGCIPGVLSVGATSLIGQRAVYSNYGSESRQDKAGIVCGSALRQKFEGLEEDDLFLDVVAPGGNSKSPILLGGILTMGGTFVNGFWQGIKLRDTGWGKTLDPRGEYIWIQGTSFSSPIVAGVVALMKAEDSQRKLTRQQLIAILKKTASYDRLTLSQADMRRFQMHQQKGEVPSGVSSKQYFFGSGLVNAEAAVREVKRQVGR